MGWEKRHGQSYYYHKQRIGGRVVSHYLGYGEAVSLIVAMEQQDREEQQRARHTQAARRAADAALEQLINENGQTVRLLTAAVLLAQGCYAHKRQWRKPRDTN